jgi:YGGT family
MSFLFSMEETHVNMTFELITPNGHMEGAKQMSRPYPPDPDEPTIHDPRVIPEARPPANATDRQQVESRTEYVEDKNLMRANMRYWIARVVYFVLGVLEVVMGLRFIFRLLGANQGSPFAMFLYSLSHVFVAPFNGIFNDQAIGNASVFEVSTLIAMLLYALIAWGIVELSRIILAPLLTDEHHVIRSRRSRTTP